MKHFYKCCGGKLCSFLLLLLLSMQASFAQDYLISRQNALNKLDLSGLGKTLFLNAAVTSQYEVNYVKSLSYNKNKKPVSVSSEEWQNLYERLTDADLRSDTRIPRLEQLIETNPSKLTKSNIVPIGIIDLESIYLSDEQLIENEQQKKSGNVVDFTTYDKFQIIYASALQEDLYQADISFKLNSKLLITNNGDKIRNVEIDFKDGSGFKAFALTDRDQLIPHHFESTGKHKIQIRIKSRGATYLFETVVNVLQTERIKPFMEFDVTAEALTKDTLNPDRSARANIVGGSIRIVLGCDQILNQAIIIGEGFDMANDLNLDAIEAKFRPSFAQYLSEGYDLVFLDYADGRAPIENNAQVMKEVIQQINTIKQGSIQNVVIGASMSGLVARYAIRKMEQDGIAHNVRLMICYDTPHQGANIPVGLTQVLWEASPTLLTQVILKFFAKGWRNYYTALSTPAAQQMLLHWGGQLTGGVGSKSPAFDIFRTNLSALGNGGYPLNCRNIAIIHGSMNAADRAIFNDYNYGDRLLRSWTPFGLQNTNIDLHTNQLNQNTNVLRFASWGIFSKRLGVSRSYNSPFNDDFLPGGRSTSPLPNKLFNETSEFDFCFLPTFSSIDYTGPRTTQNQRELLDVNAVNAVTGSGRQTPFAAIYGTNFNTIHVDAPAQNWTAIGMAEGLIVGNNTTTCPVLPVPPQPVISVYNTCYPFDEKRSTEDNTANISVSLATPTSGQYVHNWTILPTQQTFTTTGDQITFQAERPGLYQVICIRTYPGRRDLQSQHDVTFNVAVCGGGQTFAPQNPQIPLFVEPDIDIRDVWEGDFLLTTPLPDSSAVFAHYQSTLPAILYASKQNGTFIPADSLESYGMFPEFAALFAEVDPRPPLPVILREFNVKPQEKTAYLSWSTTSEINSERFEIERSNTGKVWSRIGTVAAKNLSSEKVEYNYIDKEPESDLVYYRLKMIDTDGSFAYSRIETVRFDAPEIVVYPNPVDSGKQLQLLLGDKEAEIIIIYDLSGKIVYESKTPSKNINVKSLPVGRYILKIRLKDGSESNHVVIKR